MSNLLVASVYLLALVIAAYLIYRFSHHSWIWHAFALLAALGIGLMPPLGAWSGPLYDLVIGALFLFLVVWGLGELIVRGFHLHRHA